MQELREKSTRTQREKRNFCKRKGLVMKMERSNILAVLKRIKRAVESNEKRATRLKQQEIFIPELAIID